MEKSFKHHQIISIEPACRPGNVSESQGIEMLDGRVVLITGASSGIGAALAHLYGSQGARLVLAARRRPRLVEVADEIGRGSGKGEAIAVECDVTQEGAVERAVTEAVRHWGKLDTVIANAGFGVTGDLESLSLDDYRRQFETNVFGLIRTVKAALEQVLRERGRIVLVGSVAGFIASPGASPYCMSKFSVRALAQSLRLELKPRGVSVTHLAPGFVDSEIRLKRNDETLPSGARDPVPSWLVMDTDKAARQMLAAIEQRRKQRVVTGHGKLVVFLARHSPWVLEALSGKRPGLGSREG